MGLFDLIFPKTCLKCKKEGRYFCDRCVLGIKTVFQICPVCERPSPFGLIHPLCKTRNSLDGLTSFFIYEDIIKEAIHKLKYRRITDLKSEFLQIMFNEWGQKSDEMTLLNRFIEQEKPTVIPVPLYWWKEHDRGFNQSSIIGEAIAKKFNLPFNDKILFRQKNTISQTKLKEEDRKKNVQNIFSVSPNILISPPRLASRVEVEAGQYLNILLVDDVWTTGATLKEATKTLKSAGAKKVWGLTVAR